MVMSSFSLACHLKGFRYTFSEVLKGVMMDYRIVLAYSMKQSRCTIVMVLHIIGGFRELWLNDSLF